MKLHFSLEKKSKSTRLASPPVIIFFAVLIIVFNSFSIVSTNAQSATEIINRENLLREHNVQRSNAGLNQLTISDKLNQSAQAKSELMLKLNCWSHYCPSGTSPWRFFEEAGYLYIFAGENLAEGFLKVGDVINAWMNSKTHKANILKESYKEIGFGISYGNFQGKSNNVVIAVHFGTTLAQTNLSNLDFQINNPKTGDIVRSLPINISGTLPNNTQITSVDIYNNDIFQGEGSILEGIFTFNLENLSNGANKLFAIANTQNGNQIQTQEVDFQFLPSILDASVSNLSGTLSPMALVLGKDTKDLINLIFVVAFVIILFVDILVIKRTNILKQSMSFSHYHLAIFILLIFTILIGGIGGRISQIM